MANSLEKSILVNRYQIYYTLAKNNISCEIFITLSIYEFLDIVLELHTKSGRNKSNKIPVHSARKFSAVLGTTSENNCMITNIKPLMN